MNIKAYIRRLLSAMGYEIRRISNDVGQDPFRDMRRLAGRSCCPVVMDVGANVGQSISRFRSTFDKPVIHAFEPGHNTFSELQRRTAGIPDLHLNNFALGSESGAMEFIENTSSDMSSFLEPGIDCWGAVKERVQVKLRTLDDYCAERGVGHIDILKSDTQGFDLEVMKGAKQLLMLRRIRLVYMEITFSDMYKRLPRLDEIWAFMADHGFSLVSFYKVTYQHDRAGWTDVLFINSHYDSPSNSTSPLFLHDSRDGL
jgi:FkbM family methyltransferase